MVKLTDLFYDSKPTYKVSETCICHELGKRPIAKLSDPIIRGLRQAQFADKPRIVTFRTDDKAKKLYRGYDPNDCRTYLEQAFVNCEEIGHGSFGTVYSATYLGDGKEYAIKKAHNLYYGEKNRQVKLHEVRIQELLPPHENIVHFFKAWEEADRLYIQLELCGRYSLADIKPCYSCVNEEALWMWLEDMSKALKFLHEHNIIHMDVKPDNMFLSKNGHCKFGDFGIALDLDSDNITDPDDGDSCYLAPEILNNFPTKAADVYSLGMSFIHLSVNNEVSPKAKEKFREICKKLRNGEIQAIHKRYFKRISDVYFLTILTTLLDSIPELRPEPADLLKTVQKHRKVNYFTIAPSSDSSRFLSCAVIVFLASLFCMGTYYYFANTL